MKRFGFWHDEGAIWGDHREKTAWTNLYLNGFYTTSDVANDGGYGPGKPRPWAPVQAKAFRDAIKAGKKLLVNLHMGNILRVPTPKTCSQLAPDWHHVIGLDLADEPNTTTRAEIIEMVAGVRRTVATPRTVGNVLYRLEQKPLGVTLEYKTQIFGSAVKWFVDAGIDFFCLEAYLDFPGPTSALKAGILLREKLGAQIDRIPIDKKLVLICQSYSRNGSWDCPPGEDPERHYSATTGLASLEEMQRVTFTMARELGSRCMAVTAFAYGRPSGVIHNPSLGRIHREMFEEA